MHKAQRAFLFGTALFLVVVGLIAIDLAALAWRGLASRGAGAFTVILLELAFAYFLVAAGLVARAQGQLVELFTLDRLHLVGTAVAFTTGLPIGLVMGVGSPAGVALLCFVLGLVPTAFYTLWSAARAGGKGPGENEVE